MSKVYEEKKISLLAIVDFRPNPAKDVSFEEAGY